MARPNTPPIARSAYPFRARIAISPRSAADRWLRFFFCHTSSFAEKTFGFKREFGMEMHFELVSPGALALGWREGQTTN